MACSRIDEVEIDKSGWICHIIWRLNQQNLLMNWMWRSKVKSEIRKNGSDSKLKQLHV